MLTHYRIEILENIDSRVVAEISMLIKQLDHEAKDLSRGRLEKMTKNPSIIIFVALDKDNHIVGMATMIFYHKMDKFKAFVEDVVVDANHRQQGIGEALMKTVIQKAKDMKIDTIHLTSRPERMVANIMYKKLGFMRHETNYYKYKLS